MTSAHKNEKLEKLRSHELNALLAYVRDCDLELALKLQAVLIERKQSYVILDARVSQLKREFTLKQLCENLDKPEFIDSLTLIQALSVHKLVTEERKRLQAAATCEDPHEDDVAQYLDAIQACKKFDKSFVKTVAPLKGNATPAETSEGKEGHVQVKAMAEFMFAVKTAKSKSDDFLNTLRVAAKKCGFDITLYHKHSSDDICELKVAGIVVKPVSGITFACPDSYLQGVVESLDACDFFKLDVDKKDTSFKFLSLSKQNDHGHERYDKFCGYRFVRQE